jgi:hypothetical protein
VKRANYRLKHFHISLSVPHIITVERIHRFSKQKSRAVVYIRCHYDFVSSRLIPNIPSSILFAVLFDSPAQKFVYKIYHDYAEGAMLAQWYSSGLRAG